MNTERDHSLERRAALHAALSDPARLRIVDALSLGDASPSELAAMLVMGSNLVAHHLRVLEEEGVASRHRSEGDRRRTYVRLVPGVLDNLLPEQALRTQRILFVCTANSARSQLAAALWRQASTIPSVSAGTHPAERINPAAAEVARRRQLPLGQTTPQRFVDVVTLGDFVVTVCDRAHEELTDHPALHWSVPDPVRVGAPEAFDRACDELSTRISTLAHQLHTA